MPGERELQDGTETAEEPAAAQQEETEKARRDREVRPEAQQAVVAGHRWKYHEAAREEDRDEPEDRHHDQRGVALRRPARPGSTGDRTRCRATSRRSTRRRARCTSADRSTSRDRSPRARP